MRNWAENIIQWQEKLIRIARFQEQLEAIPREREEAQKQYASETAALQSAKDERKSLEVKNAGLESQIESIRAKQKDFRSKSALIKNNDDYRLAMIQIEQCEQAVSDVETQQLDLMTEMDEADKRIRECEEAYKAGKKRAAEIESELDDKVKRLEGAILKLQGEVPELESAVEPEYRAQYLRLRQAPNLPKSAPIVVPLINTSCGRCRIQVTDQEATYIRNGRMVLCPSCQAMLYYEK